MVNKSTVSQCIHWFKYMELTGAACITFVVGILLGELSEANLTLTAEILRHASSIAALILSGALVYFTDYSIYRRLTIIGVSVLAIASISNLLSLFIHPIVDIFISLGSVLLLASLLSSAIEARHNCQQCPLYKRRT